MYQNGSGEPFVAIGMEIDETTPCLIHRESGEVYDIEIGLLALDDLSQLEVKEGWNSFDWQGLFHNRDFEVYR